MLNSEPKIPPPIPCLLNFFLQYKKEAELYHEIQRLIIFSMGGNIV